MIKKLLKIVVLIIIFVLLGMTILVMRKFVILHRLDELSKKFENIENYSYNVIGYNPDYNEKAQITGITTYVKGNKYLINGNRYEQGDNNKDVSMFYSDGIDEIGIWIRSNGIKSTTVNGINSTTIDGVTTVTESLTITGNPSKLTELGMPCSYSWLKELKNIGSSKISTDECNSQKCYFIQVKGIAELEPDKETKIWVNKETGIIVRQIDNDCVYDYKYSVNNVKDSDIVKPEI